MESLKEKFEAECRNISTGCIYDVDYWLLAENCEKIAIQSQIELLKEETERLERQSEGLKELLKPNSMSNNRIEGKRSGIKIAIENLRQLIKELESQLNKE